MFSAILLCLIFGIHGAHEVNPDTSIGITDLGITYTEALWILKDWRSFICKVHHVYSPTFTSPAKYTSFFRFQLRWVMSDDSYNPGRDTLRFRFYHSESSDISEVILRLKIVFFNNNNHSITQKTTNFENGAMIRMNRGNYIEWNWDKFTSSPTNDVFTIFGIPLSTEPDMPILVKIYYNSGKTETLENFIQHSKQTFKDFGSALLLDEDTADVFFSLPDGNRSLHSALVKLRSPETYDYLFSSVTIDKQVVTNDVPFLVFDQVMQFIYTDRVPSLETENEWKELLLGASRLKAKKLTEICIGKINKKITLENALKWIRFAKCNNYSSMENYVKNLWKSNAFTMTSKQWDEALNLYNKLNCTAV